MASLERLFLHRSAPPSPLLSRGPTMPDLDSSALWAAIRTAPDDDLPRLALADWLEENEGEAGARTIRPQCEQARLEREAEEGPPSPRIDTLKAGADRLIRKHKETLLA